MNEPGAAGRSRSLVAGDRMGALPRLVLAGLLGLVLYLLFWPVEGDPTRWRPPRDPGLTGPYQGNRRLASVERIDLGGAVGPESVALDARGRLYVGTGDGRILRLDPDRPADRPEEFARTGGRPRGLAFDRDGNLLVADLDRGLLSVSPTGDVRVLATEANGSPFGRANDVAVGRDGTVYLTDASRAHPEGSSYSALVTHRPGGRLVSFQPGSGRATVLLDSLHFANGVAVSPDGAYLLVAETGAYRIRRIWIRGDRQGEVEIVRSNLPGFPDGLSTGPDGLYWLALPSRRSRAVDLLMPHPFLRKILLRIPAALRPGPRRHGFVLALDEDGKVVHNLQDPEGGYAPVTSVVREGGWLYLGSDREAAVGRVRFSPEGEEAGLVTVPPPVRP